MLKTYPAIFYKSPQGGYSAIFPDLNHLADSGDTFEETVKNAMGILAFYLYSAIEDKEELPTPSAINDIDPSKYGDTERERTQDEISIIPITVDLEEYAKKYNERAVKKTLSIPKWLNDAALEKKLNFSQVLQEALKEKVSA